MDSETIREAQRILKALVETGSAMLKGGMRLQPETQTLVAVIEKVASRKLEEVSKPEEVDFTPSSTHHTRAKDAPSL